MATGTQWTAAEREAVRRALATGQQQLVIGPAPWPAIERRHERSTRRRLTAAALVVAAAALLAAVWILDGGGFLSGRSVAPADRLDGPVGSLAGDPVFVRELVRRMPGTDDAHVPAPGAARVLVATDLDGSRLALLRVPGDNGQWWWTEGRAGQPVSKLGIDRQCGNAPVCWATYGSLLRRRVGEPGGQGVVVAAEPGSLVTVSGPADVDPAGAMRRTTVTAAERWPGIFVAPLPDSSVRVDVAVRAPGTRAVWHDASDRALTWYGDGWETPWASRVPESPSLGLVRLPCLLDRALFATAIPSAERSRIVAARWEDDGDRLDAVVALAAPSGGWALVAVGYEPPGRPTDPRPVMYTCADVARVQAVVGRPAGDPDRSALAWLSHGSLSLLGPPGAVTARVSGAAVGVPLHDRQAQVRAPGAAGVDFLDARGHVLARTAVETAYRGPGD